MSDPIIINVSNHILIARHVFECGMSWNSQGLQRGIRLRSVDNSKPACSAHKEHSCFLHMSYAFNALRTREVLIVTKYVQ